MIVILHVSLHKKKKEQKLMSPYLSGAFCRQGKAKNRTALEVVGSLPSQQYHRNDGLERIPWPVK